jgi:cytochrome c oxidase subunit 4
MTTWRPSLAIVGAWVVLLGLLALTVTLAYLPLGAFNALIALSIAATKAAVVAAVFMELRQRGARTFIFAGAGIFWLGILLWLGLMDFLTRT